MRAPLLALAAGATLGALLIGFIIGMRIQELTTRPPKMPPIRAVGYVDLSGFYDGPIEYAYARPATAGESFGDPCQATSENRM